VYEKLSGKLDRMETLLMILNDLQKTAA